MDLQNIQNMLRFQLMGSSAGYRPVNQLHPELMADMPSMLMARLGADLPNRFKAGMGGKLIQLPDGRIIRLPEADVGYSTPFMGGNIDANYSYGPNNQQRGMVTYRRQF